MRKLESDLSFEKNYNKNSFVASLYLFTFLRRYEKIKIKLGLKNAKKLK
jgi:hypothetical protein